MGVDFMRQLHIATGAALLGVIICLFFESVCIVGYFLRGKFWVFVLDILRILGAVLMTLLYFQRFADGQIRWYDILLEILACGLFHLCVGRYVVQLMRRVIVCVIAFIKKILKIMCFPLRFVFELLVKMMRFLLKITRRFLKKVFIFLRRYIIMLLYPLRLGRKKKRKETQSRGKTKEKEELGNGSRFYH